jgi:hypothetical protein
MSIKSFKPFQEIIVLVLWQQDLKLTMPKEYKGPGSGKFDSWMKYVEKSFPKLDLELNLVLNM